MTHRLSGFPQSILLVCAAVGLLLGDVGRGQAPSQTVPSAPQAPPAARVLRDDGTYQDGGYWATPLPWLMVTVMQEAPARAARLFCDAVEDFRARKDINEWVNDNAPRPRGVRDYCASASMPLAGPRRLRAMLAQTGRHLPPELARRIARYCLDHEDLFVYRGQVRHLPKGTFWGKPEPRWIATPALKADGARNPKGEAPAWPGNRRRVSLATTRVRTP